MVGERGSRQRKRGRPVGSLRSSRGEVRSRSRDGIRRFLTSSSSESGRRRSPRHVRVVEDNRALTGGEAEGVVDKTVGRNLEGASDAGRGRTGDRAGGRSEEPLASEDIETVIVAVDTKDFDKRDTRGNQEVGETKDTRIDAKDKECSDLEDKMEADEDQGGDMRSNGSSSGDESDEECPRYVVERIEDKKVVDGTTYYYIKWKGWSESDNTWEPFSHLDDGCASLLEDFERSWAEKRNRRASSSKLPSHWIYDKWPSDKKPLSVENVVIVDKALVYVVKRKLRLSSDDAELSNANAVLVNGESFKESHPQLLLNFYQNRLLWTENPEDNEEQAWVAAQIAKYCGSKRSLVPKMIESDIDREAKDEMSDTDEEREVFSKLEDDDESVSDTDTFVDAEDLVETEVSSCTESDVAGDEFYEQA